MRMARLAEAVLAPHVKKCPPAHEFMLFPDDAHDLPDDVSAHERALMMKLKRAGD